MAHMWLVGCGREEGEMLGPGAMVGTCPTEVRIWRRSSGGDVSGSV